MLINQGSHRPGKILEFDIGLGKLIEFVESAICPGIVLEFCRILLENNDRSLKIMRKYTSDRASSMYYVFWERSHIDPCEYVENVLSLFLIDGLILYIINFQNITIKS